METDSNPGNNSYSRKANFSKDEVLTLIEEVSKEKEVIFSNRYLHKKKQVWNKICFKINAMFGTNREIQGVKKKWKDLKSATIHGKFKSLTGICSDRDFEKLISDVLASAASNGDEESETTTTSSQDVTNGNFSPTTTSSQDVTSGNFSPTTTSSQDVTTGNFSPTTTPSQDVTSGNFSPTTKSSQDVTSGNFSPPYLNLYASTAENEGETINIPVDPIGTIILKSSDGEILVEEKDNFTVEVNDSEKSLILSSLLPVNQSHQNNPPFSSSCSSSSKCNNKNNNNKRKPERERQPVALAAQKLRLKVKWLESEIAKNDSIVEVNRAKADYMRAKKARLEL